MVTVNSETSLDAAAASQPEAPAIAVPTATAPSAARRSFALPIPLGRPQVFGGLLLIAFAAQAVWLAAHRAAYFTFAAVAESPYAPLAFLPHTLWPAAPRWVMALPFVVLGLLLGASLWYVARRLYGNTGAYLAVSLYAFSPLALSVSASTSPDIAGAWGFFGAIFTAIALAHTLWAPPAHRVWRIVLLGIAIALALTADFGLWIVVPYCLLIIWYLIPDRRLAGFGTLALSCVIALLLYWTAHGFDLAALRHGIAAFPENHFAFTQANFHQFRMQLRQFAIQSPALLVLLHLALITYRLNRRSRYFGNTGPILISLSLVILGFITVPRPGWTPLLLARAFLVLFCAGMLTDLFDTKRRRWALPVVVVCVVFNAAWCLFYALPRLAR